VQEQRRAEDGMGVQELTAVIMSSGVLVGVVAGGVLIGVRLARGRRQGGDVPRPGPG
jgi:hypothetical protein